MYGSNVYFLCRACHLATRYTDCKADRSRLMVINSSFLTVLAAFTMMICLLLSAAFDDSECVLWVEKVMQSIAMQILVTGPLLGLAVLCVKLFVSWLFLTASARARSVARLRHLDHQARDLMKQQQEIKSELQTLSARASNARLAAASGESEQARRWALMKRLQQVTASAVVVESRRKKATAATAFRKNGLTRGNTLREEIRKDGVHRSLKQTEVQSLAGTQQSADLPTSPADSRVVPVAFHRLAVPSGSVDGLSPPAAGNNMLVLPSFRRVRRVAHARRGFVNRRKRRAQRLAGTDVSPNDVDGGFATRQAGPNDPEHRPKPVPGTNTDTVNEPVLFEKRVYTGVPNPLNREIPVEPTMSSSVEANL